MAPSVVLINPKFSHNVAAAIRACSCFGVPELFWTGHRVDPLQYSRLPREERMKGYRDVKWTNTDRPFDEVDGRPVCAIELLPGAMSLTDATHPKDGVYVFGPEDGTIPQVWRRFCHQFIYIPSAHCLNLSAAVNVVLYDRRAKRVRDGIESGMLADYMHENRGEIASVPGWDGQ